jgi:hypothetical protein
VQWKKKKKKPLHTQVLKKLLTQDFKQMITAKSGLIPASFTADNPL